MEALVESMAYFFADFDECDPNTDICGTLGGATCVNSPPGSYTCNCDAGYAGGEKTECAG